MSDMKQPIWDLEVSPPVLNCREAWEQRGFLPLRDLYTAAGQIARGGDIESTAQRLMLAFNGARPVQAKISEAAQSGDMEAEQLYALLRQRGLTDHPCNVVARERATELERTLTEDPASYLSKLSVDLPYPGVLDGECLAFDGQWAKKTLGQSRERLNRFIEARRSETAILVGNGPSLAKVDFSLLEGQDVYISNYAIRDPRLHRLARGVAVSNRFVALQAPHLFQTTSLWKFHPLWLGDILRDTPETIYLNGVGGPLFFSEDVAQMIAWHSTVSYFWLQILFSAGYRKVCLIGVDNSYQQDPGAREGDLIHQTAPDENHFFPDYFRGKVWQAADTGRMADTYRMAKRIYEAAGREIVNCTIGGKLEVFRRASLVYELPAPIDETVELATPAPQDIDDARFEIIREVAYALSERAPFDRVSPALNLLKPDDPARALYERVHSFLDQPPSQS